MKQNDATSFFRSKDFTKGILFLKKQKNTDHDLYNKLNHYRFLDKINFDQKIKSLSIFKKFSLFMLADYLFFYYFTFYPSLSYLLIS